MTTDPDRRYTPTPAEVYRERLAGVAWRLRDLADQVERRGESAIDIVTLRPAYTRAALQAQRTVLAAVGLLGLDEMVAQAVRADHPDADKMPGVLLDKAATAVAEARPDGSVTTDAEVAEAVLRAVGLLP